MPLIKLWNADHSVKKVAHATTLQDVLTQARQKGICSAENAKVFLKDWTELDEETFEELLQELPLDETVFVVAEVIPPASSLQSDPTDLPEPLLVVNQEPGAQRQLLSLDCLPAALKKVLEAPLPLPPRERRELVRIVGIQLTEKSGRPRREQIRIAASQVVAAYPLALEDRGIDGELLGRGYDAFFQQLENRIENTTRGKRSASPSKSANTKIRKWAYGCANWQPVRLFEPANDSAEKIEYLKREGRKGARDINVPQALEYMRELYVEQRNFINKDPLPHTSEVQNEWPLLFIKPVFYQHANELLGKNAKEIFQERMPACAPALFQMMEEAPTKHTMELVVRVRDDGQREKAVQVAVLPFLCAHFKEDKNYLYQVFEEGTSITEKLAELPSTPTIIALGSIFKNQCFVATEQQLLFSEPSDFVEATCLAFLCYYVLNMAYAGSASTSLEFLQRQIFDVNPAKGSRCEGGQKSRTSVHTKIMKLAQKLRFNQ
ncbi:uncharacterized protein LOC142817996 isoform X1 [Rhipicephalus microplus]|uniref:uncharacterized protein LOC142804236 isoform X1 n=2 Tax=Rhipicephalus microplus TaxID=6941 RepID=UPI003F6AF940